jgi:DNA-directed RNA polymerase specialized sigma24 family protein
MRILHIDNYEVCEENGKFLAASFKDYEGVSHSVELTEELEEYFKKVRRDEYREEWESRFHIDIGINSDEDVFEIKISMNTNCKSAEDTFIENEIEKTILKEINKLPFPQRRRVYLKIIRDYKNTEIAISESVDKSAVSRSLKVGLEKIFKNYKKF